MLSYYHLWQMNPTEARKLLAKDYQQTRCYSQAANNFATHHREEFYRLEKRALKNLKDFPLKALKWI